MSLPTCKDNENLLRIRHSVSSYFFSVLKDSERTIDIVLLPLVTVLPTVVLETGYKEGRCEMPHTERI